MIYEYALYYEDGMSIVPLTRLFTSSITLRPRNAADGRITNPLTLVCRQVRAETQKLPFKLNVVHVDDNAQRLLMYHRILCRFVRGLDYDVYRLGHIRRLSIQVPYHSKLDGMPSVRVYWPCQNRFQLSLNAWVAYSRSHPLCEVQWAYDLRSSEAHRQGLVLMWMVAVEIVITGESLLTLSERESVLDTKRSDFLGRLSRRTHRCSRATDQLSNTYQCAVSRGPCLGEITTTRGNKFID